MIKFYKNLDEPTRKRMEEILRLEPEEQYRVNEELAFSRLFNNEFIKTWMEAKSLYERLSVSETASEEQRLKARSVMLATQEAASQEFNKISRLAERGASIEQKISSRIDAITFLMFMDTTIRLVHEIWFDGSEEANDKLDLFESRIRETLVFREVGSEELQRLTPVKENQEMLESVPLGPEEITHEFRPYEEGL